MKRFWISWYEPLDDTEDYRPFAWPLPAKILMYACTGHASNAATLCALVDAEDEDQARQMIIAAWSPLGSDVTRSYQWRFCDEKPLDWTPGDRFPKIGS